MKRRRGRSGLSLVGASILALWLLSVCIWVGLEAYGIEGSAGQRVARNTILRLSLLEAALITVFVPLLAMTRTRSLNRTAGSSYRGTTRAIFRAGSSGFAFVGVSAVGFGLTGWLFGGMAPWDVIASQAVLAGFVLAVASLSVFLMSLFRNAVDVAGLVYVTVVVCVAGLVFVGPIVSSTGGDGVVQAASGVNPFVGVASALEFDLLRSEWVYRISPLGRRGLEYPSPYSVLGVYSFGTIMFLFGAGWKGPEGNSSKANSF